MKICFNVFCFPLEHLGGRFSFRMKEWLTLGWPMCSRPRAVSSILVLLGSSFLSFRVDCIWDSLLWLVGCYINLFRLFNAKSIFMKIGLFQTIQFSISTLFKYKYSLIGKTFLFQAFQLSQTVLIQLIQLSIITDFVYTQLNVKTVLYQTIQFSVSRVSMSKNSSISNNSV